KQEVPVKRKPKRPRKKYAHLHRSVALHVPERLAMCAGFVRFTGSVLCHRLGRLETNHLD
ncbi:MAG: hypothetical protein SGPRY_013747, partial [Prymnesium sp.]